MDSARCWARCYSMALLNRLFSILPSALDKVSQYYNTTILFNWSSQQESTPWLAGPSEPPSPYFWGCLGSSWQHRLSFWLLCMAFPNLASTSDICPSSREIVEPHQIYFLEIPPSSHLERISPWFCHSQHKLSRWLAVSSDNPHSDRFLALRCLMSRRPSRRLCKFRFQRRL